MFFRKMGASATATTGTALGRAPRPASSAPRLKERRGRRESVQRPTRALPESLHSLHSVLTLGLEPLYMPCSGMKCGDIIYRSTLDPSLRLEERGLNPALLGLGGFSLAYLFTQPGIFPGFIDYYFLAPLFSAFRKKLDVKDISLGKVLGTGGFGRVYKATLTKGQSRGEDIVVKKAYEYGEAEVWMNERLERVCPRRVPKFIDAFEGPSERKNERAPLWLVWKFEGEGTLADAIQDKSFPENIEENLLGKQLDRSLLPSRRRAVVIRFLMKEILDTLNEIHSTGIVHRDVKPQNILLPAAKTNKKGKLKFIDFGAAADLRIGINYLPKEFLLDPRYAPPEKYIMSTSTPKAPPTPVAAALSPVLWSLNRPDRFDMYSVGILLVQMCFPALRRDNQLIAFNRQLENLDYDILKWRELVTKKKGGNFQQGVEILDMDGGRGWDLLRLLINNSPNKRIGASAAASHPFVSNFGLGVLPALLEASLQPDWLEVGGDKMGSGLTEAEVEDIRTRAKSKTVREREVSEMWASSKTISWFQGRQRRVFNVFSWKAKKTVASYTKRGKKGKLPFALWGQKYKTSG